jgi:hypothetical protein
MAENESSLIRFLTYKLSYDLANQIYKEYEARMKEVKWRLENTRRFASLQNNKRTIELLLAASIFHKRVISNLDSATKFFSKVTKNSEAETLGIGKFTMTGLERNRILGAVINFNKIIYDYNIPASFMDYYSTTEFLDKVKRLKNAETKNEN